jgi:DNA-binding CsgD family transcriptional regulator/tetratricopeptide (TPR) repeat protein
MMASELIGRDSEIAAVELLLARIADGGGSLLVLGDPGIGKSALAEVASRRAAGRGMRVLACAGVPGEAQFSFAGLHQLLRPVLAEAGGLPGGQRDALLTALGAGEGGPAPAMPLVGLAALELLAAGAGRAPVLVVAEDVHWLDSSTCEVLAFVARRLGTDPVGLVGTAREAELQDNPLAGAGLAELRLGPLDAVAAAALLDAHGVLDPVVRQRVLAEAAGNPLALVELPVTAGQYDSHGAVNEWIPLTRRLEQAFASRLPGLPAVTRTALLAAGLNDGDALGEVLAAASVVAGAPVQVADLAAAVAAGLAEVDGQRARFRHPLVRAAVGEAAGLAARQAMHRALAEVLAGVPDRQVWHRAAASVGPDEEVAAGLENAADRAFGRGAIAEQAQALAAAARLSPGPALRGQRLIRAAWAFYDLGRPQTTLRLLDEAEPLDLEPGDRLRLSWYRESTGAATRSGARPLAALAGLADQMRQHGYNDQALLTLESVAIRCYWSNPDRRTRRRMTAVAEAVPVAGDDPRLLYVLAQSDPARHGAAVLARLAQHQPGSGTAYQDYLLGYAAAAVGACEQAVGFHTAAAGGLRARGSLGLLGLVLLSQGWSALLLGQAGLAGPAAEEAARLLGEGGRPLSVACAQLVQAVLAGRRGDTAAAADLAGQAERVLLMGGVPPLLALVQLARGTAALGAGRHDEAYEQLARIFDPHDAAYHPHLRAWALVDLAEAVAAGGGYQDAARRHYAELIPEAAATGSPLLRASLAVAAPMLATGDPQALFDAAFDADLAAWPLHRARLQLAYGMWLRRRQQAADSRAPLRAARDTFDALGADAWAEHARRELRAAGERSGQPAPRALDLLAPQELQIARLAAEGLSNREIGQQLYLSRRTVSNHLYRIFPKLGITSRAELAAVVGASPPHGVGH